jgi:predicted DsbA family dithiol-disulfide isomerase
MSEKPRTSRRDLLIGLAVLAAAGGGWQLWVNRPRRLSFAPLDGLPGWRQAVTDGVTAPRAGLGGAALLGLDEGGSARVEADALCRALYGTPPEGRVPVAVFSDFFCPYCRDLIPRLSAREARTPRDIDITWHELPLLGPSSDIAARAAVAADLQGGYPAFQARLMSGPFRPTPQYIAEVAAGAGLQPGELLLAMDGDIVASRITRARAASRTLGIYGTPAITVGKSLVIGQITDAQFDALVADEVARADSC